MVQELCYLHLKKNSYNQHTDIMKDQIVSRKTGKLAKQLGFNWSCTDYVDMDVYTGKLIKDYEPDGFTNRTIGKNSKGFTLPTQTALHKWFRDNYKKHIVIVTVRNIDNDEIGYSYSTKGINIQNFKWNVYKSYELALEAGLQELLLELL